MELKSKSAIDLMGLMNSSIESHSGKGRKTTTTHLDWILRSPTIRQRIFSSRGNHLLVADFASGENASVPIFFLSCISPQLRPRPVVYCIDSHELRLEGLTSRLMEEGILDGFRTVHAKLESMSKSARITGPPAVTGSDRPASWNALDTHIEAHLSIPAGVFDVGIMNNDVIGFLSEYYCMHDGVMECLREIQRVMADSSTLIVTQPGLLYPLDNVSLLRAAGFIILEAVEVAPRHGSVSIYRDPSELPLRHHKDEYRFLVLSPGP
ncbi:MAG: hypothetical protein QXS20_07900 [Candidatus Thorarchaeota archaeon]